MPVPTNTNKVTQEQLATHNSANDCWVSVNGSVYNVTDFVNVHPGGKDKILPHCGGDATGAFMGHNHPSKAKDKLETMKVGEL